MWQSLAMGRIVNTSSQMDYFIVLVRFKLREKRALTSRTQINTFSRAAAPHIMPGSYGSAIVMPR